MSNAIAGYERRYAYHLCKLVHAMDEWIIRRVVSVSIVGPESLLVHESIDFDLQASAAGKKYVRKIKGHRLPLLIVPIGFYEYPFVSFDLRDSAEGRLSLLTHKDRLALRNRINESRCASNEGEWVCDLLDERQLELVIVPIDYGEKRHIIHFSYTTELKSVEKYKLPSEIRYSNGAREPARQDEEVPKDPEGAGVRAWRQFIFAWYPARITATLTHVKLCSSYHIEFQVPDGVRIYDPEIVEKNGERLKLESGSESDSYTPKPLPPNYVHIAHEHLNEQTIDKDKAKQVFFRAWLGLDRSGFPATAAVLNLLNFITILTVMLVTFLDPCAFLTLNYGSSAVVGTASLIAVISFGYLQFPGEHALARSLYRPIRWMLATSAAFMTITAALVAVNLPPGVIFRVLSLIFTIVIFTSMLATAQIWHRSNPTWIKRWLKEDENKKKNIYGRHAI